MPTRWVARGMRPDSYAAFAALHPSYERRGLRPARATHQAAWQAMAGSAPAPTLLDGWRAFGVGVPAYVLSRFTHPTDSRARPPVCHARVLTR
ncbi:hypothetical protein G6F45_013821 [Rhizopus arrhizus]|nr:hypothetical protein G6F45_013821 [Rhizopus arrhizus]